MGKELAARHRPAGTQQLHHVPATPVGDPRKVRSAQPRGAVSQQCAVVCEPVALRIAPGAGCGIKSWMVTNYVAFIGSGLHSHGSGEPTAGRHRADGIAQSLVCAPNPSIAKPPWLPAGGSRLLHPPDREIHLGRQPCPQPCCQGVIPGDFILFSHCCSVPHPLWSTGSSVPGPAAAGARLQEESPGGHRGGRALCRDTSAAPSLNGVGCAPGLPGWGATRVGCHGMEWNGVERHGMERHGVEWCRMERHSMAQNGMAWHGVEQHRMARHGTARQSGAALAGLSCAEAAAASSCPARRLHGPGIQPGCGYGARFREEKGEEPVGTEAACRKTPGSPIPCTDRGVTPCAEPQSNRHATPAPRPLPGAESQGRARSIPPLPRHRAAPASPPHPRRRSPYPATCAGVGRGAPSRRRSALLGSTELCARLGSARLGTPPPRLRSHPTPGAGGDSAGVGACRDPSVAAPARAMEPGLEGRAGGIAPSGRGSAEGRRWGGGSAPGSWGWRAARGGKELYGCQAARPAGKGIKE